MDNGSDLVHEEEIGNATPKVESISSDNSFSTVDGSSSDHDNREHLLNPLQQLQISLERHGLLGRNASILDIPNDIHKHDDSFGCRKEKVEFDGTYPCEKCKFVGRTDDELHGHSLVHDPYECTLCGYLTNTLGYIHLHFRTVHPDIPVSIWDDSYIFHGEEKPCKKQGKSIAEKQRKPRKTPCKLCNNFVGNNKLEYYQHLRDAHAESGKLLYCDMCPFIALYKHHLEYHIRNHFGSKPFHCNMCPYSCVNRSMLNSHFKSHSNVYQYSCNDCIYITKYLHSLKMHLRKYEHTPGRTLNADGSVNNNSIIDIHGRRRGPKSKKRKSEDSNHEGNRTPVSKRTPSPPSTNYSPISSANPPILYHPHIFNNFAGNMYVRTPPMDASNYMMYSQPTLREESFMHENCKCIYCDYVADSYEAYQHHVRTHAAQFSNEILKSYTKGNFILPYPVPNIDPFNNYSTSYKYDSLTKNTSRSEMVNKSETPNSEAVFNGMHSKYGKGSNEFVREKKNISPPLIRNGDSGKFFSREVSVPHNKLNGRGHDRLQKCVQNYIYERGSNSSSPEVMPREKTVISEMIPETTKNNYYNGKNYYFNVSGTPEYYDNAPLDLTRKSPVSSLGTKNNKTSDESPTKTMHLDPKFDSTESPGQNRPVQKTHRRKGKAFRIDHRSIVMDDMDNISNQMNDIRILEHSLLNGKLMTKSHNRPLNKKNISNINFQGMVPLKNPIGIQNMEIKSAPFQQNIKPKMENGYGNGYSTNTKCHYCDMEFKFVELLQSHTSYHSENDPFTCAKCDLQCHDVMSFNKHIFNSARINGKCISDKKTLL
ncbi:protein hunchback [Caerostris extrusa]|uniref:Protein hunchback n=1 Tax=Caerostris extrusa TaxID=172846 RepID=A0AAV4U2I9_CAEEX|nr:protein hunchback [Caerostris extrusa]